MTLVHIPNIERKMKMKSVEQIFNVYVGLIEIEKHFLATGMDEQLMMSPIANINGITESMIIDDNLSVKIGVKQ